MNERIGELYTQALEYADSKVPPELRYNDIYYAIVSVKHAELIILESCEVINNDCNLQFSEGIITNLGGLNQARELIKQHFGVEE